MNKKYKIVSCLFLIVTISVLFSGCNKSASGIDYNKRTAYYKNINSTNYSDTVIKCVTFNIQLGFTTEGDPWTATDMGGTMAHIKNIKKYLDTVKPDIICLQEVPKNRYNIEVKNFIEALAAEMNMNYAFGAHGYNDPYGIEPVKGEWGNAILSKYPITAIDNFENEFESIWEKRSILTADVIINNKPIRIHSLHFLPTRNSESSSLSYFKTKSNLPQLILGDFNMINLPLLEANNYTDLFKADTTFGELYYNIDRILYTKNKFSTLGMGIINDNISPPPTIISDHLANYAMIKIK